MHSSTNVSRVGSTRRPRNDLSCLILLGLALALGLLAYGGPLELSVAQFLALLALAAGCYLLLLQPLRLHPEQSLWMRGRNLWLAALLLRLVPWTATPYLSDDVYRYLWEGRVQRAGHSPYRYPPEHPTLLPLRNADYEKVNHKDVSAAYPPVAQWLFRLTPGGLPGWKTLVLLADLALLACLQVLLRRRRQPPALAAWYAFHPLVILEFTGSAHLDALALCALVGSLLLWRGRLCGVVVALAGLIKPSGWAGAAALLWQRRFGTLLVVLLCVGAGFGFFCWDDGESVWTGLRTYARHWEFNGLLYPPLVQLCESTKRTLEHLGGDAFQNLREVGYDIDPRLLARRCCAGLAVVLMLAVSWRLRRDHLLSTFWVLVVFLLTSPTVHPWYAAWLVPFLPLARSRACELFTLTVLAANVVKVAVLRGEPWQEPAWLPWVVWLPVCLLGSLELYRSAGPSADT